MRLQLSVPACNDIDKIWNWISADSGLARADSVIDGIYEAFEMLLTFPSAGTQQRELGDNVRSFARPPHQIFYEIQEDKLLILRIIDGRRDLEAAWREQQP